MAITAQLVKELRERTGAPMMDCKKALVSTDGDIEGAIELMRKSGQTKAAKKSGRVTAEGLLLTQAANGQAILLEINSETDFVARDDNFIAFATAVTQTALQAGCTDVAKLAEIALASDASQTVEQARQALISKVGENINVRRIAMINDAPIIGEYVHSGRIGVIVAIRGGDDALAKDIAMHIAASAPEVVSPEQVPAALVDKEREIYSAQAADSGKPEDIIAKMVEGRIKKFLQEVSLTGQPYVKDPNTSVGDLLKGANAEVISFERFVLGEGIEKQVDNFAEEVMAQVQGN